MLGDMEETSADRHPLVLKGTLAAYQDWRRGA
jgi:hypothetical protein